MTLDVRFSYCVFDAPRFWGLSPKRFGSSREFLDEPAHGWEQPIGLRLVPLSVVGVTGPPPHLDLEFRIRALTNAASVPPSSRRLVRIAMIGVRARDGAASAEVTFTAGVNGLAGPICVVGDFNDWDPYAHQMPWSGDAHRVTVPLDVGRRYVFQYLAADGYCFNDEAADDYELNEFGGTDSVLDLRTPGWAPRPQARCSQIPRPEGALPRG